MKAMGRGKVEAGMTSSEPHLVPN